MSIIPEFFKESVVSLGIQSDNNHIFWVATGFLVGRKEEKEPGKSSVYIITNKHVINQQKDFFVRFNKNSGEGVKDLPMALYDVNGMPSFSIHEDNEIDVCAIRIAPGVIEEHKLKLNFFDLDEHTLTLEEMKNTGVEEGSLIYALGFPMNLVGDKYKVPICRLGDYFALWSPPIRF